MKITTRTETKSSSLLNTMRWKEIISTEGIYSPYDDPDTYIVVLLGSKPTIICILDNAIEAAIELVWCDHKFIKVHADIELIIKLK